MVERAAALPPAFPLAWPPDWERTEPHQRGTSPYRVTMDAARRHLEDEMRRFGARHFIVTTDLPVRLDGKPLASARSPDDPGVSLWWFDRRETARAVARGDVPGQRVIACDRWRTVRENMRACGLAIEALRALQRSGATQILDRAVAAFDVPLLPAGVDWRAVLELDPLLAPYTKEEVERAYKRLAPHRHPDRCGGNADEWHELQRARDAALRVVTG